MERKHSHHIKTSSRSRHRLTRRRSGHRVKVASTPSAPDMLARGVIMISFLLIGIGIMYTPSSASHKAVSSTPTITEAIPLATPIPDTTAEPVALAEPTDSAMPGTSPATPVSVPTMVSLPTPLPIKPAVPVPTETPVPTGTPVPNPTPVGEIDIIHNVDVPFDWYMGQGYMYQGAFEPAAQTNCGPASVAMATRFTSGNTIQATPEQIRDLIPNRAGKNEGMYLSDELVAMEHFDLPHRKLSFEQVEEALARGHIVQASVVMSEIEYNPGANTFPERISGRYYKYESGHSIIIKGLVEESRTGQRFFIVYDPNVWHTNPKYFYGGDERYPKGRDRLYRYEQVEAAYIEAVEYLATPDWPITPTPEMVESYTTSTPETATVWCPSAGSGLVDVFWCDAASTAE